MREGDYACSVHVGAYKRSLVCICVCVRLSRRVWKTLFFRRNKMSFSRMMCAASIDEHSEHLVTVIGVAARPSAKATITSFTHMSCWGFFSLLSPTLKPIFIFIPNLCGVGCWGHPALLYAEMAAVYFAQKIEYGKLLNSFHLLFSDSCDGISNSMHA